MSKILEVKNFYKNYGSFTAVSNVSFEIEDKEIFALIGPNGAGKSTALKTIATILSFERGNISICGVDLKKEPEKVRDLISYLPEEAGAYKNLTGIGYLDFMASLYAKNSADKKRYVDFAREICGLGGKLKDKVSTYSKGMTRKLLISRAIMTRPKLAILDEPTSGLDVVNAMEVRNIIKGLKDEGMSVLLSSHNMLEIEYLADRIAIINHGKIIDSGTISKIKSDNNARNLEEAFVKLAKL